MLIKCGEKLCLLKITSDRTQLKQHHISSYVAVFSSAAACIARPKSSHVYLPKPLHTSLHPVKILHLQPPLNSLTTIWVQKSSGGNKKLSGGNGKLPLRRFPTVGIVRNFRRGQTQLPPQT